MSNADQIRDLLPPGILQRIGFTGVQLLEAFGDELDRLDLRVEQLILEQDPRTTTELVGEWERTLGLPDPCHTPPGLLEGRRAAILARLAGQGGATAAALVALALTLGYPVQVEDHRVASTASTTADSLWTTATGWPWAITVHAPVVTATFFRAGAGSAGDPLAEFENDPLECVLRRHAPAHAFVRFVYDLPPHPADYQPWGNHVLPDPLVAAPLFQPFELQL